MIRARHERARSLDFSARDPLAVYRKDLRADLNKLQQKIGAIEEMLSGATIQDAIFGRDGYRVIQAPEKGSRAQDGGAGRLFLSENAQAVQIDDRGDYPKHLEWSRWLTDMKMEISVATETVSAKKGPQNHYEVSHISPQEMSALLTLFLWRGASIRHRCRVPLREIIRSDDVNFQDASPGTRNERARNAAMQVCLAGTDSSPDCWEDYFDDIMNGDPGTLKDLGTIHDLQLLAYEGLRIVRRTLDVDAIDVCFTRGVFSH